MKMKTFLLLLLGLGALLLAVWAIRRPSATRRPEEKPSASSVKAPSSSLDQEAVKTGKNVEPTRVLTASSWKSPAAVAMSVQEIDAILRDAEKHDHATLFHAMLAAGRPEPGSRTQLALRSVLSTAIRLRPPAPGFFSELWDYLDDPTSTSFERNLVTGLLGDAAKRDALDLLVRIATSANDDELRKAAIGSIRLVGSLKGDRELLAPALDRLWSESGDLRLVRGVAEPMAKIGAPSSIKLLLDAALSSEEADQLRKPIALSSLTEVYQAAAVPPLAARLANQPPTSDTARLVAPVLVGIGDPTAAAAVLGWLQSSDADASPLIHEQLLPKTRTPAMLATWQSAVNPAVPFRNERNREAIKAALAKRKAGRKLQ